MPDKKDKLINKYSKFLLAEDTDCLPEEAEDIVHGLYRRAEGIATTKRAYKVRGSMWHTGLGDHLFSIEDQEPLIKKMLDRIRSEGATDREIKWYNNLAPIEQALAELVFRELQISFYSNHDIHGWWGENMYRYFPHLDNLEESDSFLGEDRPLPPELSIRIDAFIRRSIAANPQRFEGKIKSHSSMNELLRYAIRKGEL